MKPSCSADWQRPPGGGGRLGLALSSAPAEGGGALRKSERLVSNNLSSKREVVIPHPHQAGASGAERSLSFCPYPNCLSNGERSCRKWLSDGPGDFWSLCLAPGSFGPCQCFWMATAGLAVLVYISPMVLRVKNP